MSYARMIVADRTGKNLGEIRPDLKFCAWRIGNIAKARFTLSPKDADASQEMLRFGNRLLIQFENGLPNWGGVIDPPRTWTHGEIEVTAYSAEQILKYRQTAKSRYFAGVTPGSIYKELINDANALDDTGIKYGNIWTGGSALDVSFHLENLFEITREVLSNSLFTAEFDITAREVAGSIVFEANFYERKGNVLTGIALLEGSNVTEARLTEQGPIVNYWEVAGKGTSWGEDRLTAVSTSPISIDEFGLRQGSGIYSQEILKTILQDNADINLLDTLAPFNAYELEVLDEDPGEFSQYNLGDHVTLSLHSYGFGGTNTVCRIKAREYRPDEEQCTLIVQEV